MNQKIQIRDRWANAVLFETDTVTTLREAVALAVLQRANLQGANLRGANLQGADLRGANLRGANLQGANLYGADLQGANLQRANLQGANLYGADLQGANLQGANLQGADLRGANLQGADLQGANLYGADLQGANLRGANLYGADLREIKITDKELQLLLSTRTIVSEGDLIGYKKLQGGAICKLLIPEGAARIGGLVGRKCRAEYARVLEGEGRSKHDYDFQYTVGATVRPDKYDPNPFVECSSGIHFFITRAEAEAY